MKIYTKTITYGKTLQFEVPVENVWYYLHAQNNYFHWLGCL